MALSSQRILSYIYAGITLLILVSIIKNFNSPSQYDIIITNGEVFDGSGSPSVFQDIGIVGNKIHKVGNLKSVEAKGILMQKA